MTDKKEESNIEVATTSTVVKKKKSVKKINRTSKLTMPTNEEITETQSKKRKLEDMEVDNSGTEVPAAPIFPADKTRKLVKREERKVPVPHHRLTPLKNNWTKIFTPIVENLKLNIRFDTKSRVVQIRTSENTDDISNLQKAADFVQAFIYGFDVDDALALLRLHDLYVETFDIKDVKLSLSGDHVGRAVGRIAGKGGKTRFTLENATKTRIIVADSRIHILGAFQNIAAVRRAICNLILGSPPSKVFGNLKTYADRICERV